MIKKIIYICLVLILLLSFVGCEKKTVGLNKGFNFGFKLRGPIFCGVKSNVDEFDVNNIELDFYFGCIIDDMDGMTREIPGYERFSFAIYFHGDTKLIYGEEFKYPNIQEIEGYYFIKQFSVEDFISEKFNVENKSTKWSIGVQVEYSYHEKITVPSEILADNSEIITDSNEKIGKFYFSLLEVYYSQENNDYILFGDYVGTNSVIKISFNYISDNLVKLS